MSELRIGPLQLDPQTKSAHCAGAALSLSPNSFHLLQLLMERAPAVISVDEILEQVWAGKIVHRDAVKQQIRILRTQLGSQSELVESVRGHGYRLKVNSTASSSHQESDSGSLNQEPTKTAEALSQSQDSHQTFKAKRFSITRTKPLLILGILAVIAVLLLYALNTQTPTKPKLPFQVAVLPFETFDSESNKLGALIQDDMVTLLSKQDDIRALAISATSHMLRKQYGPQDFAEEMNVDLIFEGSIRHYQTGYRVNIRMLWTHTGVTTWRKDFTTTDRDRERLVQQVSGAIEPFIRKKVEYYRGR